MFRPVDGASLAVFRMFFGFFVAYQTFILWPPGKIEQAFIKPAYHFHYLFFPFVKPWPGDGMYYHFLIMGAAAVMVAFGVFYRLACSVLFFTFTYAFLLEKTYYNNHYYLICLLSFLLIFLDAHRSWSVDCRHNPDIRREAVAFWQVALLQIQIVIVYFYGGVSKINADWVSGDVMRPILAGKAQTPLVGTLFQAEWMVSVFSFGGLFFDLLVGPLLLMRRTRFWALAGILFFNLCNHWLFGQDIGIFPFLMIAATGLFFDPGWPRRWIAGSASLQPAQAAALANRPWVTAAIGIYVVIQILLPLRHWLYPGDVAWTQEGDRFTWRMKLNHYLSDIRFTGRDEGTGQELLINIDEDLNTRQADVMASYPDMILQYAHFLRDRFKAAGWAEPEIYAHVAVSLNGRPFYPLIDPSVNLSQAKRGVFSSAEWILPLPKE